MLKLYCPKIKLLNACVPSYGQRVSYRIHPRTAWGEIRKERNMKRFLTLALSLVMLISTFAVLTSCFPMPGEATGEEGEIILVYDKKVTLKEDFDGKFKVGQTVKLPKNLKKSFATFIGWYTTEDFQTKVSFDYKPKQGGEIKLYARFADWIDLEYDFNGGQLVDPAQKYTTSFAPGVDDLVLPVLEREDYIFSSWYFDPDFMERADYDDIDTLTYSRRLYAKWIEGIRHASVIYMDGETELRRDTYEYQVGMDLTYTPREKLCYTFAGWYTDPEFKNPITAIDTSTKGDVIVYAKYEKTGAYVTYMDGDAELNQEVYNYGAETPLTYIPNEKLCYTFVGWFTDPELQNQLTAIPADSTADLTLYAKYVKSGAYVIYMDGDVEVGREVYNYDAQDAIDLVAPKKLTYDFVAWYLDAGLTEPAGTVPAAARDDFCVYAKYDKSGVYIKYVDGSREVHLDEHRYGATTAISYVPEVGELFRFDGWFLDADFNTPATELGPDVTEDVTIYGKFVQIKAYLIYMDGSTELGRVIYDYGTAKEFNDITPPEKRHNRFDGWCKDIDCTAAADPITETTTGDVVVYAKYTEISSTVTYMNGTTEIAAKDYLYGEETPLSNFEVGGGNAIVGWYTDSALTTPIASISADTRGYIVVYAKVEKVGGSINYMVDGALEQSVTFKYGQDNYHAYAPLEKEGYTFAGWYADPQFTTKASPIIPNGHTEDVTVYAKFARTELTAGGLALHDLLIDKFYSVEGFSYEDKRETDGYIEYKFEKGVTQAYIDIPYYSTFNGDYFGVMSHFTDKIMKDGYFSGSGQYLYKTTIEIGKGSTDKEINILVNFHGGGATYLGNNEKTDSLQIYGMSNTDYASYADGMVTGEAFIDWSAYDLSVKAGYKKGDVIVYTADGVKIKENCVPLDLGNVSAGRFYFHTTSGECSLKLGSVTVGIGTTHTIVDDKGNIVMAYEPFQETALPETYDCDGIFEGWYADPEWTIPITGISKGHSGVVTVYPKIVKTTVSYETNGGKINDESYSEGKIYSGTDVVIPTDVTKENSRFMGWFTDAAFQNKAVAEELAGDVTLYAFWAPVDPVIFYTVGIAVDNITILNKDGDTPITYVPDPIAGYIFAGWYTDADLKNKADTKIPAGTNEDITLYARFDKLEKEHDIGENDYTYNQIGVTLRKEFVYGYGPLDSNSDSVTDTKSYYIGNFKSDIVLFVNPARITHANDSKVGIIDVYEDNGYGATLKEQIKNTPIKTTVFRMSFSLCSESGFEVMPMALTTGENVSNPVIIVTGTDKYVYLGKVDEQHRIAELKDGILADIIVDCDYATTDKDGMVSYTAYNLAGEKITERIATSFGLDSATYFNMYVGMQLDGKEGFEMRDKAAFGMGRYHFMPIHEAANWLVTTDGDIVTEYESFEAATLPTIYKGDDVEWYLDAELTQKITGIEAGHIGIITVYPKSIPSKDIIYMYGDERLNKVPYLTDADTPVSYVPDPKAGYLFEGWYTDKALTTKAPAFIPAGTENKTVLYAKFIEVDLFNIDGLDFQRGMDALSYTGRVDNEDGTITYSGSSTGTQGIGPNLKTMKAAPFHILWGTKATTYKVTLELAREANTAVLPFTIGGNGGGTYITLEAAAADAPAYVKLGSCTAENVTIAELPAEGGTVTVTFYLKFTSKFDFTKDAAQSVYAYAYNTAGDLIQGGTDALISDNEEYMLKLTGGAGTSEDAALTIGAMHAVPVTNDYQEFPGYILNPPAMQDAPSVNDGYAGLFDSDKENISGVLSQNKPDTMTTTQGDGYVEFTETDDAAKNFLLDSTNMAFSDIGGATLGEKVMTLRNQGVENPTIKVTLDLGLVEGKNCMSIDFLTSSTKGKRRLFSVDLNGNVYIETSLTNKKLISTLNDKALTRVTFYIDCSAITASNYTRTSEVNLKVYAFDADGNKIQITQLKYLPIATSLFQIQGAPTNGYPAAIKIGKTDISWMD